MDYLARVQAILQDMEEISGPELEEYIEIMEAIKEDVDTRLVNAAAEQCRQIQIENARVPSVLQHLLKK